MPSSPADGTSELSSVTDLILASRVSWQQTVRFLLGACDVDIRAVFYRMNLEMNCRM